MKRLKIASILFLNLSLTLLAIGQKKDPATIKATWNCVNNICVDPGDGTGEYDSYSYCQSYCNYADLFDGLYGIIPVCIDVVPKKSRLSFWKKLKKYLKNTWTNA